MSIWPWSDLVSYVMRYVPPNFAEFKVLELGCGAGANIVVGDFTQDIPYDEVFHLVVDRALLTHNTTSAIKNTLSIVRNKMRPGSKFIGIDWFSTEHTDFRGEPAEDYYTRKNYSEG